MKRVALLVTLSFVCALRALAQQPVEPIERPQLATGDRWVFRTVDLWTGRETAKREISVVDVNAEGVQVRTRLLATNGATSSDPPTRTFYISSWPIPPAGIGPEYKALDFPLHVGKKWTTEFTQKIAGGSVPDIPERRDVKAEGWEIIRVPAGEFRALRVVHDGIRRLHVLDGEFGTPTRTVLWYVPEVKLYVKRTYRNNGIKGEIYDQISEELVEYESK